MYREITTLSETAVVLYFYVFLVFMQRLTLFSKNYPNFRCKCQKCDTNLLSNIQEYRCCKEVGEIMAKLSFEGVESACVIDHPDFDALCNATVLEQVCGMMKDKRGRSYKFPSRGTRNEKNE